MIELIEFQDIQAKIYTIRGMKVILDRDLAALYQVKTEALNESVKRNRERFPEDFMFRMNKNEFENWTSQIVMSDRDKMGLRRAPYVFTQEGVAMLSSILRSTVAIRINVQIMRAFIEMRQVAASHAEYTLLWETVKRIESTIDVKLETMSMHHLVDHSVLTSKMTQLSKEVLDIRQNLSVFSQILDQFQNTHIIIKRPDEGEFN